jgi:thiosulfate dehydrogenase [quinone] large subunit
MAKQIATSNGRALGISLDITRILLGFIFLWAFLDKTFGLGKATPSARAWLEGGSPTTGFLSNVDGTFGSFFNGLAGNVVVDWLFMLGLLGVGVGLMLGIAVRVSAVAGSAMLFLMWLASLPLANNPIIDDHLVYIAALAAVAFGLSLQRLSLGSMWRSLPFVKDNAWLQ